MDKKDNISFLKYFELLKGKKTVIALKVILSAPKVILLAQ